jgi:hypothetical protein
MLKFINTHAARLKFTALILMLALPFLLHGAVVQGAPILANVLLGLFILNMLFVMKYG